MKDSETSRVLRTLYGYISRDLVRVCLLALVAFTLVMTVFAIVEPLRKQGLAGAQVLRLFAYTLPVMVSLTLPIAALFAATIVYGRLAQEREVMAANASGIGTVTLLRPALLLGGVVTVVTLALSNYVTPELAKRGEEAIKRNIRGIVYHRLKTEGVFQRGGLLVHADRVNEQANALGGVVAVDMSRRPDLQMVVASDARVHFSHHGDQTYVSVTLRDPARIDTGGSEVYRMGRVRLESPPLPNFLSDKPEFYNWQELVAMEKDPTRHGEVRRAMTGIRRQIGHSLVADEVVEAIRAGRSYDQLRTDSTRFVLEAPRAQGMGDRAVLRSARTAEGPRRVRLTIFRDGRREQQVESNRGVVRATWSAFSNASLVTIELTGNVRTRHVGETLTEPKRRTEWRVGNIPLPEHIRRRTRRLDDRTLLRQGEQFTDDPSVGRRIENVRKYRIPEVYNDVLAEMHSRIAYGVSCFLLVWLGAALGVIFRGGQLISAFTFSMIPAGVVIVLVQMGKQMVVNRDVEVATGVATIWSGAAVLAVANLAVYARLMRR